MVAHEIGVDGPRRSLPYDAKVSARFVRARIGKSESTEPTRFADGNYHVSRYKPAHRRLKDRQINTKELPDAIVGPHDISPPWLVTFGPDAKSYLRPKRTQKADSGQALMMSSDLGGGKRVGWVGS
jgi:hypothetical protein